MFLRIGHFVCLLALLAACEPGAARPSAGATALTSYNSPRPGVFMVCQKALTRGVLAASADDPHLAWLTNEDGRIELTWPPGFGVRFSDPPEIVAPNGSVVTIAGQGVTLGGGFSEDGRRFTVCEIDGKDWSGL